LTRKLTNNIDYDEVREIIKNEKDEKLFEKLKKGNIIPPTKVGGFYP